MNGFNSILDTAKERMHEFEYRYKKISKKIKNTENRQELSKIQIRKPSKNIIGISERKENGLKPIFENFPKLT